MREVCDAVMEVSSEAAAATTQSLSEDVVASTVALAAPTLVADAEVKFSYGSDW